ncbi:hypothetical protein [Mesorhizobium sp.]|uniref:hypothetical protein n=1 Tax=Mesorhizobium sp. TaxID=1871066 RepID=UPI0012072E97|nr:hypothetical protein [Mesorhizobium sp.]TIT00548.1 MAG: hypothetical protein E5W87_19050 [Mesorhizobium sp.]
MTTYDQIRRYEAADAAQAVTVEIGSHGFYRYVLWNWHDPESPYETQGYWLPAHWSGVYESADQAESDATAESRWLREARNLV